MTCLQASKRMESGEISREEFLNMAHQIKQLYQYQEEIQLRKDSWDESDFPVKKQPPLLSTPSSQPRPHEGMDPAELSYYEHKSKLRKTQVNHRPAGEEWEGEETPEITDKPGHSEKMGGGQSGGHPPPHKYNRGPRDRPGERHMINKLAREQSFIKQKHICCPFQARGGAKSARSIGRRSPPWLRSTTTAKSFQR